MTRTENHPMTDGALPEKGISFRQYRADIARLKKGKEAPPGGGIS